MRTGRKRPLTAQQAIFATQFAKGGNGELAARRAGYHAPAVSAADNLRDLAVLEQIRREQHALMIRDLLPIAIEYGREVLRDPNVPHTARSKVFQTVIDNTIGKSAPDLAEPDIAEMTLAELQTHKAELQRMLDESRRPTLELEAQEDDLFG